MNFLKVKRFGLLALAITGMFVAAGCVQPPPPPRPAPPPQAVFVPQPPPADIVEIQPPPPDCSPYWVWQPGHWRWNGYRYFWVHGHWAPRPPRFSQWIPPHWQQGGNGGWFFVEGHWQ